MEKVIEEKRIRSTVIRRRTIATLPEIRVEVSNNTSENTDNSLNDNIVVWRPTCETMETSEPSQQNTQKVISINSFIDFHGEEKYYKPEQVTRRLCHGTVGYRGRY